MKNRALRGAALLLASIAPATALAVETSATVSAEHAECDVELWHHLERQARERADTFCAPRGGVDEDTLRWVHHDSPHGAEEICVVHLHYGCRAELPSDRA